MTQDLVMHRSSRPLTMRSTRSFRLALAEDLGDGDVTTLNTIPPDAAYTGDFLIKAPGVIAGLRVAARVFAALDPAVRVPYIRRRTATG